MGKRCSTPGRPAQYATRTVFFVAGFGMAAWAPLVPYAKLRVGISESGLGLVLLSIGIGSVVAMPLAGALASRFGCRIVIIGSAALLCSALPFLATVARLPLLAFFLFSFGAGLGAIDVAMNIQAISVERSAGRAMMSGFHGLFSFGGIAGAAGVSAMLGIGTSPLLAEISAVAVSAIALAAAAPYLLAEGAPGDRSAFAVPRGTVLFIGCLCFIGFLIEGSVLDWSALFLISVREIEPYYAGLGFACFSATMTLGRLVGDRIVRRLGGPAVIGLGGAMRGRRVRRCHPDPVHPRRIARLRAGRGRMLKCRPGPVQQRRATNGDAGERRRSCCYRSRLCGHSPRAGSDRVYRASPKPFERLPGIGHTAPWGGCERPIVAGVAADCPAAEYDDDDAGAAIFFLLHWQCSKDAPCSSLAMTS